MTKVPATGSERATPSGVMRWSIRSVTTTSPLAGDGDGVDPETHHVEALLEGVEHPEDRRFADGGREAAIGPDGVVGEEFVEDRRSLVIGGVEPLAELAVCGLGAFIGLRIPPRS